MSLTWFYRLFNRWQPWQLAATFALVNLLIYTGAYLGTTESYVLELLGSRKTVGIFLLFSLLPAYLIYMTAFLWRRTDVTLEALTSLSTKAQRETVKDHMRRLPAFGVVIIIAAAAFGASQNLALLQAMFDSATANAVDVAMFIGNCVLWCVVGAMLSWRINVNRQVSYLGEKLTLDIYRLDQLQPLARLATIEILVVAGALAFLPLQSLDAKLDSENYLPGMTVGIPSAAILFLLPLWGAHRNIVATKSTRLAELRQRQDLIPRDQLSPLETVTAHIDRVKSIPNWPIDIQLITRIFFYVVIAPLAWVCAALVERVIDSL